MQKPDNKIILFIGPSGSGKTTIIRSLVSAFPCDFVEAVSTTSRPPRNGEIPGKDYYYVTENTFLMESLFVEKTYYAGNYYGLTYAELYKKREQGTVLVAVDMHGAREILKLFGEEIVKTIYVEVSSIKILEDRMIKRGDSPDKIQQRLKNVIDKKEFDNYKYCQLSVNNDLPLNTYRLTNIKDLIIQTV